MSPLRVLVYGFVICLMNSVIKVSSLPCLSRNSAERQRISTDDMIFSREQYDALLDATTKHNNRVKRNVVWNDQYRWPNNTVHFRIEDKFTLKDKLKIFKAMRHIEVNTCIRFKQVYAIDEDSIGAPHVLIRTGKACNSEVGYQNRSVQYLTLWPLENGYFSCMHFGLIVHELLHTLGFYHQHSAHDRDNYVRIIYENIESGEEYNFAKFPESLVSNFGVDYDFSSIMHYEPYAFSHNRRPTIEALKAYDGIMGQRAAMTEKDILKINRYYNCKEYADELPRNILF